jgi:uncharacterized membrane protein (UPF0182 family)
MPADKNAGWGRKQGEALKKSKYGLWIVVIGLVLLGSLFFSLVGFITDFLWFRELGYVSVFLKKLFTQLKLGVPTFLVITLLSYLYLMALKRGYYKKVETIDNASIPEKVLNGIGLGLSAVFGGLFTFTVVTGLWFEILKFFHSTDFGLKDPIFNMDISFYIFRLEFITQINNIALAIIIAFAILTLLFYMALLSFRRPEIFEDAESEQEGADGTRPGSPFGNNFGSIGDLFGNAFGMKFGPQTPKPGRSLDKENLHQLLQIASRQIQILGVLFFLLVAVNFWLRQYSLLYSSRGVLYGAGFTDINITLWVYRIMIVMAIAAAILFVMAFHKRSLKMGAAVPVLMIIVALAGTGAASLVQNLIVSPDEISKETPYLKNNIKYTQHAYDLADVSIREFAASNTLTKQDIINNIGTISNIRINDFAPALKFYNQAQVIRPYYQFNDVDVDRYMINGKYTQTFQSVREIDDTKIEGYPWLSKHLLYTHGYGIALSRVDKVTASGQPDMLLYNIPPTSLVDEIEIERPEIYFGESTRNYIITNTDEQEFDYPQGDANVKSTYKGNAGIHLNLFNRIMFAIKERNLKILVSTNIDSESRIIINRNINERVRKIAPFIEYDADPYAVTVDGKMYWIIDAYVSSRYYPYSEPFNRQSGVNYLRNSIKIAIDMYNGDTNYYLMKDPDPIALTLQKIFPKLFKDFSEMPDSLKKHIRYPNMMLNVQAIMYAKYHMNNVEVFYQSEDKWDIANEMLGSEPTPMTPNYYILKIPGEKDVEFINSIPYTPAGKKNMTALLMARSDGENYGQLILFQLPKSKLIYGPQQIEGFIDQDTNISKEFTLWSSSGSSYTRGNMFVIPIEDSLVYVEPVYLEATSGSLPEVKRVIIYYNDRIAYEPTLGAALESMFGAGVSKPLTDIQEESGEEVAQASPTTPGMPSLPGTPTEPGEGQTVDSLIKLSIDAYNNAMDAQKKGDWASYGRYIDELNQFLQQLDKLSGGIMVTPDDTTAAPVTPAKEPASVQTNTDKVQ